MERRRASEGVAGRAGDRNRGGPVVDIQRGTADGAAKGYILPAAKAYRAGTGDVSVVGEGISGAANCQGAVVRDVSRGIGGLLPNETAAAYGDSAGERIGAGKNQQPSAGLGKACRAGARDIAVYFSVVAAGIRIVVHKDRARAAVKIDGILKERGILRRVGV